MLKATFLSMGLLLAVTAAPAAAEARPQGRSHVAPARDRRGDHYRHRRHVQTERQHHRWSPYRGRWTPPAGMHRRPDRWHGGARQHRRGR